MLLELDLSANQLQAGDAEGLAAALVHLPALRLLNLDCNALGTCVQHLVAVVSKCPALQLLSVIDNGLGHAGALALMKAIETTGRPDVLVRLVSHVSNTHQAILDHSTTVRSFDLELMRDELMVQVAYALTHCPNFSEINVAGVPSAYPLPLQLATLPRCQHMTQVNLLLETVRLDPEFAAFIDALPRLPVLAHLSVHGHVNLFTRVAAVLPHCVRLRQLALKEHAVEACWPALKALPAARALRHLALDLRSSYGTTGLVKCLGKCVQLEALVLQCRSVASVVGNLVQQLPLNLRELSLLAMVQRSFLAGLCARLRLLTRLQRLHLNPSPQIIPEFMLTLCDMVLPQMPGLLDLDLQLQPLSLTESLLTPLATLLPNTNIGSTLGLGQGRRDERPPRVGLVMWSSMELALRCNRTRMRYYTTILAIVLAQRRRRAARLPPEVYGLILDEFLLGSSAQPLTSSGLTRLFALGRAVGQEVFV